MTKSDQFHEIIGKGISLVDFNTPWCGPCRHQSPIIKELSEQYKNRANIFEVNIDEKRALAFKFNIRSIPTMIIFKDGKEIERFVGLQSAETLCAGLNKILQGV